jgi:hypothetical protein
MWTLYDDVRIIIEQAVLKPPRELVDKNIKIDLSSGKFSIFVLVFVLVLNIYAPVKVI